MGVRIRSLLDDPVTITDVSLSWSGSTPDQKLKKIRDETESGFDVVGSGTSPVSKSGLAIDVGGEVSVGDACAEATADGSGTTGDGTGGTGTSGGSASGSSGGTAVDGGPGSVVGAVSGFNISNTTTLGGMRQGRLLWREIVR